MSDEPRDRDGRRSDGTPGQDAGQQEPSGDDSGGAAAGGPPEGGDRPPPADPEGKEPSAPWERPGRWHRVPLDPARVDGVLGRLSGSDPSARRRRRQKRTVQDWSISVPELVAALSDDAADPGADQTAAPPDAVNETVLPRAPGEAGDRAPVRDLNDPISRTDSIPKLAGGAADRAEADSVLAALRRQHVPGLAALEVNPSPADAGGTPPPISGPNVSVWAGWPAHRRRRLLYAGRSLAALVAVLTLLGMGVGWNIENRAEKGIQDHVVVALDPQDTRISSARTVPTVRTNSQGVTTTQSASPPARYAPENILLLGSDTRAGVNSAIGGSDSSTEGVSNSDTLMVAHISGDRQHVTVLSIPRDTLIPAPTCKAWNSSTGKLSNKNFETSAGQIFHINSAYAVGGPKCTVTAIQGLTGLGIDRIIGIDFAGFQSMIDALGGIRVNICRPIVDTVLGTVVPQAGTQSIAGRQAVNLVRARDVIGDNQSDLARIRRQQVVLSAILRQVTAAGTLLNPAKLDNFLQAFTRNTFTDNVKLQDLVNLAGSLGSLDPARVTFYTLPTVPSTRIDGALEVDETKASTLFDDLVNDLPLPGEVSTPATTRAKPTPVPPGPTRTAAPALKLTVDPSKVALEIYNLTGKGNVAGTARTSLNALGFKVTEDQVFRPEDQTETATTVQFAPANLAAALTVAAAVPGSTMVLTPGLGPTVRLVLGTSYTGFVSSVSVGQSAPPSLGTAISTGPSVSTTAQDSTSATTATAGSTKLSSVNAGEAGCV